MAYSLTDAQSLQRHQEMLSRASGRYGGSRATFMGAQSLPLPRAPFLSSTRKDSESRLMSLPPMSLPESAVLGDVDDNTGKSVPLTFGSLRNSEFGSRMKQPKLKNSTLSSSVGDLPFGGVEHSLPTLLDRSTRSRVRQRQDAGELQQQYSSSRQQNEVGSFGESHDTSKTRMVYDKNGIEFNNLDNDHASSLLGTSLTALGIMEFSKAQETTWNDCEPKRENTPESLLEMQSAPETKEKDKTFDYEEENFESDFLRSPHNPDTVEAFDLDLFD